MLILACGSRNYRYVGVMRKVLAQYKDKSPTVLHGGAEGADKLCGLIAERELGYPVIVCKADWDQHGRAAGIIRNNEMLDRKPDVVLAFWDGQSAGTRHTIEEATRRGIPVEVYRTQRVVAPSTLKQS